MRGAQSFDTLLDGSFSIHLGVGRRRQDSEDAGLDRGTRAGSGKGRIVGKWSGTISIFKRERSLTQYLHMGSLSRAIPRGSLVHGGGGIGF